LDCYESTIDDGKIKIIEVGTNIVLAEYKMNDIYKWSELEAGSDTIHYNLSFQNIPKWTKWYISSEGNLIKSKEPNTIIIFPDFGQHNTYQGMFDRLKIQNDGSLFGAKYSIEQADKDYLYEKIPDKNKKRDELNKMLDEKWTGSCHGFSTLTLLLLHQQTKVQF